MPNLDKLLAQKGTLEAVLRSVGKSRVAVNRITFIARRAGPAAIAIDIVMTVVVIDLTPPAQRGKVAAQQAGGMVGSVVAARYGGLGGAWAGAELFLLLGSPALAIPVVGEITEGGAMMAGSVFGFFAGGLFGWKTGQAALSGNSLLSPGRITELGPMMTPKTVIDRINTWTKKRRRELRDERRGRIAINRSGIEIHKLGTVSDAKWADIEAIKATKVDVFMGDIISLIVLITGGVSGQVSEHDPEWYDLIEAISEHLPGSLPFSNWAVNLVAENAKTITVYQRGGLPD